jgi:hypothetical protein
LATVICLYERFAQNDPGKYNVGMNKLKRLAVGLLPHRLILFQTVLLLTCSFMVFTAQAIDVIRFTNRSLYINSPVPGATTKYVVSLTPNNQGVTDPTIGSVELLFCYDPIPSERLSAENPVDHHPCVAPTGLDVSHAVLSDQTGETGFTIASQTTNRIVLTRTALPANEVASTYTFDNIVNPTDTSRSFAIRLSDYNSTDASGAVINLGSVLSEVGNGPVLETQVPPQLVFCLAGGVDVNCTNTLGGNYTDMGNLDPERTLLAESQMAVGTNASDGFVITVNGPTMEAGTHVINALTTPTVSAPGNSQFGINLRANTEPNIGQDPDGQFTNAVPMPDYDIPNEFVYRDGDVVASAPNVSLLRRFTVSYIVNSPPELRPGVYTTTLTFICSGRF